MNLHDALYLRETIIFLLAAGILVPLLSRWRLNPVLGYLLIGVVIGPAGIGQWTETWPWLSYLALDNSHGIHALAELGVIFLLFMIGLELSTARLFAMRRMVFGLGGLQVLLTGVAIGAVAYAWGNSLEASAVLGACLALSSTAIVMQLLADRHAIGSPVGRSSFAILLMQDLAVVPILFLVGVVSKPVEGSLLLVLARVLLEATLMIMVIYFAGRYLVRPLLHMVARTRKVDMFMAATLLTILGIAMLTSFSGLSMAMGAFLAGLLLSETEFRHEIEVSIEPFKGLLLALFFISVGIGLQWELVQAQTSMVLLSVIGLFLLKAAILFPLCLAFGLSRWVAIETALLLGQGGEFALVVVGMAKAGGLLPEEVAQFMMVVTGISMLLTPVLSAVVHRLVVRWQARAASSHAPVLPEVPELGGHVLIAGFGRVGRLLARTLDADGIPYLALDRDGGKVGKAREDRKPVYFGDASRPDLLRRMHIEHALAVVITLDNAEASEQVLRHVRAIAPHLHVIARAADVDHARRLQALGALEVIPETVEASLQLAGRVLALSGIGEEGIRLRVEAQREIELMQLQRRSSARK